MGLNIKLTPEGSIIYLPYLLIRFSKKETKRLFGITKFPEDCSPEFVHLEISNKCNLNCDYCYVDKKGDELDTKSWKNIIKELAEAKVFQITFGGGEPTLREDLEELANYVKSFKLMLCMTTNGINLFKISKNVLSLFNQINVSYHENLDLLKDSLLLLKDYNIRRGINYCVTVNNKKDEFFIKEIARETNAEILYLTYKPVKGDVENVVLPKKVYSMAKRSFKEKLSVAIDGLTCNKCLASNRFCDIDHIGNVFPCSFIRNPIGNVLKTPFNVIWSKRNKEKIECPYLRR